MSSENLRALREKLLLDMKKKKAQRAHQEKDGAPEAQNDPQKDPNQGKPFCLDPETERALLDLRALGYTFDMIVGRTGVSRKFLESCFHQLRLPIPVSAPVSPVPSKSASPAPPSALPSALPSTRIRSANSKYHKQTVVAPEWLQDHIIEASSDEDDQQEQQEQQQQTQQQQQQEQQQQQQTRQQQQQQYKTIKDEISRQELQVKILQNKLRNALQSLQENKSKLLQLEQTADPQPSTKRAKPNTESAAGPATHHSTEIKVSTFGLTNEIFTN